VEDNMTDFGLLVLRLTVGTLMTGHGTQKLFGWFKGPGLKGTHGFMEMLGIRPGKVWGTMVAIGETSGGLLTALGFLNPLGPLNIAASMIVAARRVHWDKGIWNQQGGIEFPLTNLAAALTLIFAGPGRFSLDRLFGVRLSRWMTALAFANTAAVVVTALNRPEIAEKAMEKVQAAAPGPLTPTEQPDLMKETRPRQESEQQVPVQS
jgi:putative oxidoreductase